MSEPRESNVERTPGRRPEDQWHVNRGVPVAAIAAFLIGLVGQTAVSSWFIAELNGTVKQQGVEIKAVSSRVERTETKIDELKGAVSSGNVPTAINARRIDELERGHATLSALISQISARVAENERRLATSDLRQRAQRDR